MWASPRRWLFALRSLTPDLGRRLGSWRLSVVLMIVAALYYGFLAIWATSSPPQVVQRIARLAPFWLTYALLLINTGVCLWRRLPRLGREISAAPRLQAREPDWELATAPELGPDGVDKLLRRLGYRALRRRDDSVTGVRGRWAALGTLLFHGAFFLIATAFLVTLLARQEARIWVTVGEEYRADPDQLLSVSAPRLLASGVPEPGFRVTSITPEFWRDQLLFTRLEAALQLDGGRPAVTRINRPLWLRWGTFLRLSGFGYAPRYELADRNGLVLDSSFVKLDVFPPGRQDYFSPPSLPHRIYLEVIPDFAVQDGEPVTLSLNLQNPAVSLRVYRGRLDLGNALLRPKDSYGFEGLTLRFPEIRYWGEFTIVRDPGAPLLFAAYLIAVAGLLLKLGGPRKEAEWRPGRQGGGILRGWGGLSPRRRRRARGGLAAPRPEAVDS